MNKEENVISAAEARVLCGRDKLYLKVMKTIYAKIRLRAEQGHNYALMDMTDMSRRIQQRALLELRSHDYEVKTGEGWVQVWTIKW